MWKPDGEGQVGGLCVCVWEGGEGVGEMPLVCMYVWGGGGIT